jgi:predicted TIM-barrel fold metal-dependent hydrolase
MKTPWGDIRISDAHVHFLSHFFFEGLSRQKGSPVQPQLIELGIEVPERDPSSLAARWVQELDRHSVESAALIASLPEDEESIVTAVRDFPRRFHGYFMLDPTQPGAVGRVASALGSGLRGICFFPAMHRYSMHDERVIAVLESVAERKGIVIFVHCGVLSVGIRAKLGLPSRFDMRYSNPIDLHAIALRFPKLNFVIPHHGAGYFREALMVADMCPNVYFDTSSTNSWIKYQVPVIELHDVLRRSLSLLGPRHLLFGTDSSFFPRGWHRTVFDNQLSVLADLGVSAEDVELIFGANLRRLVGLD